MSRLLDDALPLDTAGRRRWLEQSPRNTESWQPALSQALFPQDDTRSGSILLIRCRRWGPAPARRRCRERPEPSERVGRTSWCACWAPVGMAEVWLRSAPTAPSSARWR